MTKKLFKAILSVSLLTMVACLIFIISVQHQLYSESQLDALKSEAYLISQAIMNDSSEIEKFQNAEERITLIDIDGNVLYDNKADAGTMENHSRREEVLEAKANQSGTSVRYSDTVSTKTCYYAVLLENGNILRVSDQKLSIWSVLLQLLQPIAAIVILILIFALSLATIISKKILKPLNEMNFENPELDETYDELAPLISRINTQKAKINRQINELTHSRREFEVISENMNEGLLLTDKKGNVLTHNKSIEKLFGLEEDINGKNILTLNRSESFRTIFENILNSSHSETLLEYNGRYYLVTANPVLDDSSKICGAVVLIIDITEKEQREKLRREFTANVSHELKTPLTSILGISDMIKSGIVAPEDINSFAEDINKEALRLITLVNDIIRLSQLDEGAYYENGEVTNLKETALEVYERLLPIAEKNSITLNTELQNAEIYAEKSLVFEIIYNLCENAIKYNKQNGSVIVSTGIFEGRPFVKVKDTGIGIAEEHLHRVFERFYRVDKSRSKQSGGTGLGLSIVKHIAASIGGSISINSKLGVGTEISVFFTD